MRNQILLTSFASVKISGWFKIVVILVSLAVGRVLAGETATAVATLTAGFVTGITVTSGGSGYGSEPSVTLSGGGGSGASAIAILTGDKVAAIVVLTAGSGYTTSPTVVVEAPPKPLVGPRLRLELVPKLTVEGLPGSLANVQSAESLTGPWVTWTNVLVSAEGVVLVDLSPGSATRFYRALVPGPTGPADPAGFVWIKPGTFVMGSSDTEVSRSGEEGPQTKVTISRGFWMGKYEVTQAEYMAVVGSNPSFFQEGPGSPSWIKDDLNRPVEKVNWNDAVSYCANLTDRERAAGRLPWSGYVYRLPTEAEWEYAARAGSTTRFSFGDDPGYTKLGEYAWSGLNSSDSTHPVGQKLANPWGLHDMMGNVWEWCLDWYGSYPGGSVTDPRGPATGSNRVYRGGSWSNYPSNFRSAARYDNYPPGYRNIYVGFRLILAPGQ